jgi:hypothetical protein
MAETLGDPGLADIDLGGVVVRAAAEWVGGAKPEIGPGQRPPRRSQADNSLADGCDMTFCQLYGHYMPSGAREGDIVGLSVATTSWNVGSNDCQWFSIPDERHPFIVMNMYRLKDDRFEQIGMSHIKHGFYALGSHQCEGPPCTYEPPHSQGHWLGTGCTDTYSAPLNAVQSGMGPKYEVNPWTGLWDYSGSHMEGSHSHDSIQHRIQVHDADLDPALNEDATYYSESFYCMLDDIDVISSASWKEISIASGAPGGHWTFTMSGSIVMPKMGFAIADPNPGRRGDPRHGVLLSRRTVPPGGQGDGYRRGHVALRVRDAQHRHGPAGRLVQHSHLGRFGRDQCRLPRRGAPRRAVQHQGPRRRAH